MQFLHSYRATLRNPIISLYGFHFNKTLIHIHFHCFCSQKNPPQLSLSLPPMPPKIVTEYAKSDRSLCKKCSKAISQTAPRLGSVLKNRGGFDTIHWHHLECFPFNSEPIDSVESIQGFSSLQSGDQEALKKLVVEGKNSAEEVSDESKEGSQQLKQLMVQVTNDDRDEVGLEERIQKKLENPPPQQPNTPRIIAEYAKSDRSSCKRCSKMISKKALRLGSVVRDPRGFESAKWHHVDCFPFTSEPIDFAESIQGFSSLESGDQEALKKLVVECKNSTEVQVTDKDRDEVELEERSLKRSKLSTPSREDNLEMVFSVSDIKDNYKDAKLLPNWKAFRTIIFLERDDGLHDSKKIAAFDFDGCLVNTSVKRIGADAWSLMYSSVPEKLQRLYNDGYKLVIFTNESNIDRWIKQRQKAVDSKIGRLSNFIKRVKVPIQVFIGCGIGNGKAEDPFRKPKPGMWRIMEKHFNSGISIDMDQSFYVGDAAGRNKDHSDADIKFAQAIGLKFYVPEEYFGS
ncbi:hypothetical protein Ddye_026542 [Dipteronia dyeriana]|uniref:PARP-type domain-containing protein n=1 Tax=Dipteronia dyeriana TaxID=168575 RepID=A0AAD9WQH3_9ROSI|nr:hypothetical protein Ddye_026542 [Dipteronia dyeriana]